MEGKGNHLTDKEVGCTLCVNGRCTALHNTNSWYHPECPCTTSNPCYLTHSKSYLKPNGLPEAVCVGDKAELEKYSLVLVGSREWFEAVGQELASAAFDKRRCGPFGPRY